MSAKYKVLSRLLNNELPRHVADTMPDVTHSQVIRWKRELDTSRTNGTVAELMDMDQEALDEVLEMVSMSAPALLEHDIDASLGTLSKSLSALDALQSDFILTASQMNIRVRSLAMSAENVGDLSMLSDVLCNLQSTFFNKNVTNVQVNNDYGGNGEVTYGAFLDDKPTDN